MLGVIEAQQRNLPAAESLLTRAADMAPGDAGVWINLGNVLREQGRHEAAVGRYGHAFGLAPRDAGYVHAAEGPDDMPAHIRTALSGTSLSIPVMEGQMVLGTWQGLYLVEHRDRPHSRDLVFHLIGA